METGAGQLPAEGKALVEVKNVVKHFHRGSLFSAGKVKHAVKAVDGVSLNIFPGETLGLVGESGCGKSTLGRLMLRLYRPTAGEVVFNGHNINALKRNELQEFRSQAQIIFQHSYASLNPQKTVGEILSLPLRTRDKAVAGGGSRNPCDRKEEISALLERVGLSPGYIDAHPRLLSGGQRQRVGIARALAVKPRFIVADEPVSALDVSVQAQIMNLLQELQTEYGLTYLFVAHDLSVIHYMSSRVAVMYLGKIVEMAGADELFQQPLHPYTKMLLAAVPTLQTGKKEPLPYAPDSFGTGSTGTGCRYQPRCRAKQVKQCRHEVPVLRQAAPGHYLACYLI